MGSNRTHGSSVLRLQLESGQRHRCGSKEKDIRWNLQANHH